VVHFLLFKDRQPAFGLHSDYISAVAKYPNKSRGGNVSDANEYRLGYQPTSVEEAANELAVPEQLCTADGDAE
jgi:hypothetical protein